MQTPEHSPLINTSSQWNVYIRKYTGIVPEEKALILLDHNNKMDFFLNLSSFNFDSCPEYIEMERKRILKNYGGIAIAI